MNNATMEQAEFLPAALEILHTPASPIGRGIAWTIILLLIGAGFWAALGRLDVVAVSRGKVITQGRSKEVQSYDRGIVRGIHVMEGSRVRKGDLLLELESVEQSADLAKLEQEAASESMAIVRLETLLSAVLDGAPLSTDVGSGEGGASSIRSAQELDLMSAQYALHQTEIRLAEQEIDRVQAQLVTAGSELRRIETLASYVNQRVEAAQRLSTDGLLPRLESLQLEQEQADLAQQIQIKLSLQSELNITLAQARTRIAQLRHRFVSELQAELKARRLRATQIGEEQVKVGAWLGRHLIKAPIDGQVQQLTINTLGAVVTPAQALMVIVPDDADLLVEAWVDNSDIGFIAEGQPAVVKMDAFPFTRFGYVEGKVRNISADAIVDETGALRYLAQIALPPTDEKQADTRKLSSKLLAPGMAASVEIQIGRRPVFEYLLSPLVQSVLEAARER